METSVNPIHLLTETVISLAQAAKRLPPFRQNRPISPATIWRWIKDGVKLPDGTKLTLEAVRLGGRYVTSVEALSRFSERQTFKPATTQSPELESRTSTQRKRASERAEAELKEIGF